MLLKGKVIILCSLLLLLVGCWDRTEINDLAVIVAIGVEKAADNAIQLTVQIRTPNPQETGGPLIKVKQGKGKTIVDAMAKLQEETPRKLFWSHNQALFISEELAKGGIGEHLDFFARFVQLRLRTHVFITKEKMIDLLSLNPGEAGSLGTSAGDITKNIVNYETGLNVDIRKLLVMSLGDTKAAAIPWLELVNEENVSTKGYKVNGIAIVKNDKMVDYLDSKITRGVLWLRDEIEEASITLEPTKAEEEYISFKVIKAKTKVIPTYKNGKWKILLKITAEDDVAQNQTNMNVMDPPVSEKLEKQLEKAIETRIQSMLEIVQKDLSADILKFGDAFHRKYPKKWVEVEGQWDDIFRELEITMETNVKIERPGSSTKSVKSSDSKEENK